LYDDSALTEEGRQAVMKMHGGGERVQRGKALDDIACFEAGTSTMDHLCIRVRASPFDEEKKIHVIEFMTEMGVGVIDSGK